MSKEEIDKEIKESRRLQKLLIPSASNYYDCFNGFESRIKELESKKEQEV